MYHGILTSKNPQKHAQNNFSANARMDFSVCAST